MVDGTLVKKYKHPGPVFGCDWSPNNRYVDKVVLSTLALVLEKALISGELHRYFHDS